MTSLSASLRYAVWLLCLPWLAAGFAAIPVRAQQKIYNPIALPSNDQISDTLTELDIPTGEGGFARDYTVQLQEGDQVAIDLTSDEFDTMIVLLAADGSKIGENDDGPDGTTNSLLFSRITEDGTYILRVRTFGETGSGNFTLKLTRLRPVGERGR